MEYYQKRKAVHAYYQKLVKPVYTKYGLTDMEFSILMFLHYYPEINTASDLVKTASFSKSHVSMAVNNLVKNGYLETSFENNNHKTVHLHLLDKADSVIKEGHETNTAFVKKVTEGISKEEIELFDSLLERMYTNIKE